MLQWLTVYINTTKTTFDLIFDLNQAVKQYEYALQIKHRSQKKLPIKVLFA